MSIKDTAQSIIKSINGGDTLTTISLGADNFRSDSVKIASVLLSKGWVEFMLQHPGHHHTYVMS